MPNVISWFEEFFPRFQGDGIADVKTPVLLVVGGEKRGITRAVLSECDGVVCLDYGRRFGAALSAASAASILAFEIFRQNREKNGEA